ncbi:hypothetical protein F5I97DRAFT_1884406 [Phlebopus sp. FC_14]|nr:hypothetical protein F5I97DRAFT_1884406 [Phlebopus sp. FC_14]
MPLDKQSYGQSYLASYGWSGKGTGLRHGAIERPLAIPPKKNLGGLGKDRDEAFPFWDHLFAAASKAITIKVTSDEEDDPSEVTTVNFNRTTTGIISNRRPVTGTPASVPPSGTATPDSDPPFAGPLSLIGTAKREAAKRGLYSRFFRGPVLGPDHEPHTDTAAVSASSSSPSPPEVEADSTVEVPTKVKKENDGMKDEKERLKLKRLRRERKKAKAARKAEKANMKTREEKGEDQLKVRKKKANRDDGL